MPLKLCITLLSSCFLSCCFSRSCVVIPHFWNYRGHNISYEKASVDEETTKEASPKNDDRDSIVNPILIFNGFGVGSFHQHRLMRRLLQKNGCLSDTIYCVDYLGQGKSWPKKCNDGISENEIGMIYSGDTTWMDQITHFIEEVILSEKTLSTKVHIVGNSVGGHLATFLAAYRPDLVESICLLNTTPVWGMNLPGWSGHLPAPKIPRWIGRYLFDRVRDLKTLEKLVKLVYVNQEAHGEKLAQQMRLCTEGNGGHTAFASMLWSPPITGTEEKHLHYYECLGLVECDILLVFGRDDPLCRPALAKKMLKYLSKRQSDKACRYVELTNLGHCPNHEAPNAVAQLLCLWINEENRSRENLTLVESEKEIVRESWGETTMQEQLENDINVGLIDRILMALF